MRTLVIETATAACSVALLDGTSLVAERHEEVGRGHAERLIPMIATLPGKGRADTVLVDCGPGSFTGVRVGVAAARGLALGWHVPAFGYSSLALLAATADWQDAQTLAVAIHGGHGQFFVQRFIKEPMRILTEPASLLPEAAAQIAIDPVVVGDAAAELVGLRGSGIAAGGTLSARDAMALPPTLRALPAAPIYGRAPDAKPLAGIVRP